MHAQTTMNGSGGEIYHIYHTSPDNLTLSMSPEQNEEEDAAIAAAAATQPENKKIRYHLAGWELGR